MHKALLPLLFLLPFFAFSQRTAHRVNGPHGQSIGFYQFLPPSYNHDPAHRSPMIIFLHGIGEKGTGSEQDLMNLNCCGLPRYIALGNTMTYTWNGKKEGFVVLYPQLASKY